MTARSGLLPSLALTGVLAVTACGGDDESDTAPAAGADESGSADDAAGSQNAAGGDGEGDGDGGDGGAAASRPTRDELCAVIDAAADELAIIAGITEIEERTGTVLGSDCAVESTSVGYVSLSLLPAITQGLDDAAASFDGTAVPSTGLTDGILIEDPTGLTQIAVFDLDGVLYQVQVESDVGVTDLSQAEEAAALILSGLPRE
ncbi:MAG: hypothetical protein AAGG08_01495 [Actinomycetota bacterium]